MRKSGLQDMKKRNRQLVMETVLAENSLSRIEIAQKTELSPSTVSGLVSELLAEGLLAETGLKLSTGGRSRTELTVNQNYGCIAVAEIGRLGASLTLFDMGLNKLTSTALAETYLSGNDLLVAITSALFRCLGHQELRRGQLAGFGLLFQEDMKASEFNVMYSTGFSSASIPLKEALVTQFRVPVVEEYTQTYTVSHALGQAQPLEGQSSAHIAIGGSVVASITLEGKQLELKGGHVADLSPLVRGVELPQIEQLALAANLPQEPEAQAAPLTEAAQDLLGSFAKQIGSLVAMLCTFFSLETVFLSGPITQLGEFMARVEHQAAGLVAPAPLPPLKALRPPVERSMASLLADRVRRGVLCAG